MLSERVTIAQLLDSGIRLSWREALAITQSVADAGCLSRSGDATCTDLLSGFALDADGTITAVARTCAGPSLSELALFLVQLLPGENAPVERRAPAAVHLAIGRALEVVEAPPFSSVEEFTRTLARLERDSRPALLRAVYERCVVRMAPAHEPVSSPRGAGTHVAESTGIVEKDRRTSGPRVDALRRMIRERDHHDYLSHADRLAKKSRLSDRAGSRAHGPSVDMLRRWLREADRQQFEMLKSLAAVPSRPSVLPFTSLALAVCLTAGLGFAQRQSTTFSQSAAARPTLETRPAPAGQTRAAAPTAGHIRAGAPEQRVDQPAGSSPGGPNAATGFMSEPALERSRDRGATPTQPVKVRRGLRAAAGRAFVDASERSSGEAARQSGQRQAIASARVATEARLGTDPVSPTPLTPARRWAPLRLLSAIRHRLSAAFTGP